MSKSLRTIALLAVSTAVILAGKQAVQAQAPIWVLPEPEFVQGPRLGFIGYFNGSGIAVPAASSRAAWLGGLASNRGTSSSASTVCGSATRGHWHALLANAAYRGACRPGGPRLVIW